MYKREKRLIGGELGHSNATNPHMILVPKVGKKKMSTSWLDFYFISSACIGHFTLFWAKNMQNSKNYKARYLVIYPC